MKKVLTIATLTMAMTTVPLTAHAETVDEANQATQTAWLAYQQAETEKNQAWNDSHGDVYSDAWQTADAKSKALYNAYLDARQHAGLVSAEAKRNSSSSQAQEPVSSSNSSASETQDLTGDSASKASNDNDTKSATPTNDNDTTKAIQTADSNTKSATPTNDSDTKSATPATDHAKAIQTADSDTTKAIQTSESNPQSETVVRQPVVAGKTSKTLPQTGNDVKNKTMLTLIGSGAMGIATVAMIILIKKRRHN